MPWTALMRYRAKHEGDLVALLEGRIVQHMRALVALPDDDESPDTDEYIMVLDRTVRANREVRLHLTGALLNGVIASRCLMTTYSRLRRQGIGRQCALQATVDWRYAEVLLKECLLYARDYDTDKILKSDKYRTKVSPYIGRQTHSCSLEVETAIPNGSWQGSLDELRDRVRAERHSAYMSDAAIAVVRRAAESDDAELASQARAVLDWLAARDNTEVASG